MIVHVHIAQTRTRALTNYFHEGEESESVSVPKPDSGKVFKPLDLSILCTSTDIVAK